MNSKTVLYILSTNYAGSHFLSLQLASHRKCISVGELHRLDPGKSKYKQSCHICESDDVCPVFAGLRDQKLENIHPKLISNIETNFPGVDTLIDNSKKTDWAQKFVKSSNTNQKYVHLIRDPRALVRRWMMNYDSRAEKNKVRRIVSRRAWPQFLDILTGSEANVYAWKWVYQNQLITKFLTDNNLNYLTYTYDELVFEPDLVLNEIMSFLGHDYEPTQKEYWNFIHHGSQKSQYMKPPNDSAKTFDIRWKDYLEPSVQDEILNHTGVNQYLKTLGCSLGEDGLVRNTKGLIRNTG